MSLKISDIYIYPVKSLGGFRVNEAPVTPMGFEYDRRWMLVDNNNKFITQRDVHSMALLQTAITETGLHVFHKQKTDQHITVPFLSTGKKENVQVWEGKCEALVYDHKVSAWFSDMLHTSCRLVYMPDETRRHVDTNYAKKGEITAFSDGYPFLIIGQSSLNLLNSKTDEPLSMDRFRPNIVFTGDDAHAEDNWKHFSINEIDFFGVKTCSRCLVTTIDQRTAITAKEPLKTLAGYRSFDKKIKFGMNLLHKGSGIIKIGDEILLHPDSKY
jgi:uncharacterized protein